jgi:hypothetical protein
VYNLFQADFCNRLFNRRSVATAHEPMPGPESRE